MDNTSSEIPSDAPIETTFVGNPKVEMSERSGEEAAKIASMVPSLEEVRGFIEKTAERDPAKRTELLTRAQILHPLLDDPNRLGMTEDHIQTVRNFARIAGEKEGAKVKERLSQSPIEQIDQVLASVEPRLKEIPNMWYGVEKGIVQDLHLTSISLRSHLKSVQENVMVRQQQLLAANPGATMDDAFDSFEEERPNTSHQYGLDRGDKALQFGSYPPEVTGLILQGLGVQPEGVAFTNFIEGLKRDGKWQDGNFSDATAATYDKKTAKYNKLDSDIPGVTALIYHKKPETLQGGRETYKLDLVFDTKTYRDIIKEPQQPSIFGRTPASTEAAQV